MARATAWHWHDDARYHRDRHRQFYLAQYQAFRAGKTTKDEIVNAVLESKYAEGADAGKTVESVYMDQYEAIAAVGSQ